MHTRTRIGTFAAAASLALAMATGCSTGPGLGESQTPIIGGTTVAAGALPSVGALATNAGSLCTGTLISTTTVLTAAHCVDPDILKQALMQQGKTPPSTITYKFTFAHDALTAHPSDWLAVKSVDWNKQFLMGSGLYSVPGQWNDIAVVHLASAVTGHPIQKLASPAMVAALAMGSKHLVAGYGETTDGDTMSAGTLTDGTSGLDDTGDHEVVAGVGDTQQACHGDSGGPIFVDGTPGVQFGIASRLDVDLTNPPKNPACNTGLLYTRVDAYLGWLYANVSDLSGQPPAPPMPDGGTGAMPDGGPGAMNNGGGGGGGGCAVTPGAPATGAGAGALLLLGLAAVGFGAGRKRRG